MNQTTIKRGIGAVVLALVAATLLAFLLKDKAAQRQEVVEIALPGADGRVESTSLSTRFPTLTTDNSGSVIVNAGNGTGVDASANANVKSGTSTGSSISSDGTVIASATASAAAALGSVKPETIQQTMDFSVKPKAPKASEEFLNLDLVNNGQSSSNAAKTTASAAPVKQNRASQANTDQGVVIASSAPKSSAKTKVVQPRLIGEKRSAPPTSANTAKVITKKVPAKRTPKATVTTAPTQTRNGFAIQLLATSSLSRANSLKNVMAGEGYSAYVTKIQKNGKTLYRVRIGRYTAKAQAVSAQAAMKRRYKKNTNVNRSAIVAR